MVETVINLCSKITNIQPCLAYLTMPAFEVILMSYKKQAQICAEGCEGENFTRIDTEGELTYRVSRNSLDLFVF